MNLDNFGIELEFASPILDHELADYLEVDVSINSIYVYSGSSWEIGDDISVTTSKDKGFFGVELKSPKFQIFPEEKLTEFCELIKELECKITPTSGLHFHFSGPSYERLTYLSNNDLENIAYRLYNYAKPNKERVKYCHYKGGYTYKKCALRQINLDHWECRVFNSTFDIGVIKENFYKMLEVLDALK